METGTRENKGSRQLLLRHLLLFSFSGPGCRFDSGSLHHMRGCGTCPLEGSIQVPPQGRVGASIAFVGEGPGQQEVEARPRRPFVGRSGEMLNWMLERAEISRRDVWVTNAAMCMPGALKVRDVESPASPPVWISKKKVLEQSVASCRSRLIAELEMVSPRVIVAVGAYALKSLTGRGNMAARHGAVIPVHLDGDDLNEESLVYVIPMHHPAHLLRKEHRKTQACLDILRKAARIAREGPREEGRFLLVSPHAPGGGDVALEKLEEVIREVRARRLPIALDVETTDADARRATLTVVGFGVKTREEEDVSPLDLGVSVSILTWNPLTGRYESRWTKRQLAKLRALLSLLLASPVPKWYWNQMFDITVLEREFPRLVGPHHDGIFLHWLSQPDMPHGLAWACQAVLDVPAWKADFHDAEKEGTASDDDLLVYNAQDARHTAAVIPTLRLAVAQRYNDHLYEHQRRVDALARKAYLCGIPVDMEMLEETRRKFEKVRFEARNKILAEVSPHLHDCAAYVVAQKRRRLEISGRPVDEKKEQEFRSHVVTPESFNLDSPDHASWFLYEYLKLPIERMTLGGADRDPAKARPSWSSKAVLEHLQTPLVKEYVDYGEYDYRLDRLREMEATVDTSTGRMHIPWNTTGQSNPRWSSKPNVQNYDKVFKKILAAPSGYLFVGADAAQLEMRILACFAGVKRLLKVFARPPYNESAEPWKKLDPDWDSHALVQFLVYGDVYSEAPEDAKAKMRYVGKRTVYCLNYGGTEERVYSALIEDKRVPLELRAWISRKRVVEVYKGFFAYFPEIRRWAEAEVLKARRNGYQVYPPLARRRYWPVFEVEENKVRNTPIQGSAGDIVNLAFLAMDREISEKGLDATFVLHGHDACFWLTKEEHAPQVAEIVGRCFQTSLEGPAGKVHIWGSPKVGRTVADVS